MEKFRGSHSTRWILEDLLFATPKSDVYLIPFKSIFILLNVLPMYFASSIPYCLVVISCHVISYSPTNIHCLVSTMWTHTLVILLVISCATNGVTSFQERHRMIIPPKTESCFFLADMQEGYVINIRYLVMSSKNGKQLDITMRLRDNTKRMITYQVASIEDVMCS